MEKKTKRNIEKLCPEAMTVKADRFIANWQISKKSERTLQLQMLTKCELQRGHRFF